MVHPVLTDSGLSIPIILIREDGNGNENEVKTRGVVFTDFVEDSETMLAGPHGMEIKVPDPPPIGTPYRDNQVKFVSIPS